MINQNRLELLQQAMLQDMTDKINQRKKEVGQETITCSDEAVFSNLKFIYDEQKEIEFGEETGKSYKYMPKQYKAMTMRLIAPDFCFSHKINHSDTAVTVEVFMFLDKEDAKPIATGKATVSYSSIPHDDKSEWEIKMFCESTAKGLAESKAYQAYGIGSWYSYRYDAEENPDIAMKTMQQKSEFNPEKAEPEAAPTNVTSESTNITENAENNAASEVKNESEKKSDSNETAQQKQPDNQLQEEAESISYEQATIEDVQEQEEMNSVDQKPSEVHEEPEAISEQKDTKTTSDEMSLEEARAHMAMIGKAKNKGLTLGETCDQYPGNIAWMYANAANAKLSAEDIMALTIVAQSNSTVIEALKNYGISL